jgi:hypothetical protein
MLAVILLVLPLVACSTPRLDTFDASDARMIAESTNGERLYVTSDYLWGERVYLVREDGASRFVGSNSAPFDYTHFGAISDSHLVWIVDDYDYPTDGAVHAVFHDRETRVLTRWDYELASDVFPYGLFIWEGGAVLCGDTLRWKQGSPVRGEASLAVRLSATGDLDWTELSSEEAENWSLTCS